MPVHGLDDLHEIENILFQNQPKSPEFDSQSTQKRRQAPHNDNQAYKARLIPDKRMTSDHPDNNRNPLDLVE